MKGSNSDQKNISGELMLDVYLVELSNRFTVISAPPRSRRLLLRSDISDILSFTMSHELRKYLLSYGEQPIIIPTLAGDALVLPQLFATCRIFAMVFFKCERTGALLRLAESEQFCERVACLGECEQTKSQKCDGALADRLSLVLDIADRLLCGARVCAVDTKEESTAKFNMLFDTVADILGISVNLSVDDDAIPDECFDAGLFNSFCISTLLMAQRYSGAESADVHILRRDFGLSVAISFESHKKISRVSNPDIAHFAAIAEANNMIFESSFEDGRYETCFTPARKDWSLLELKFPSNFEV